MKLFLLKIKNKFQIQNISADKILLEIMCHSMMMKSKIFSILS